MKNEQIVLNQYPEGIPNDQTFKYENIDVQTPKNGELQIESLYISVDPYMRGRMTPSDSYVQPFKLNQLLVMFWQELSCPRVMTLQKVILLLGCYLGKDFIRYQVIK